MVPPQGPTVVESGIKDAEVSGGNSEKNNLSMMISPFVIAAHRSNNDFMYAGRPQACRIATRAATTVSKLWMRGSGFCTCMYRSEHRKVGDVRGVHREATQGLS